MRESALGLAPAKAGRQVSWAGENREVLSLAFGLTVPVQRKLPVSVLTVLPKGRLCVTCEMSHLRQCVDGGLPLEHASLQSGRPPGVWRVCAPRGVCKDFRGSRRGSGYDLGDL